MKLTQIPNFRVEDFISEQAWIGRLFIQLNPLIQTLNQIFDQNIDFSTNIRSVSRDYHITSFQSFSFPWGFTQAEPNDVRIIKAIKGTDSTPTILLCAWNYDNANKVITVSRMVEVNDTSVSALSGRYKFTVRATV